jgi:transcriptional regulator with XRE-family HTH domain
MVKRLKDIRQYRELSQERLAEISGVSRATIARIETRPEYQPREETIESLTTSLGVIDLELLSDEEFDHELSSSTLDELLQLNRSLSEAAEQEEVGTGRHHNLVTRIDKVIDHFKAIAGPFGFVETSRSRKERESKASARADQEGREASA